VVVYILREAEPLDQVVLAAAEPDLLRVTGTAGTSNTGGGGGGAPLNFTGGKGGSGIVVVRYPYNQSSATVSRSTSTTYAGSSGSLNVAPTNDYIVFQNINAGATTSFNLEAYVRSMDRQSPVVMPSFMLIMQLLEQLTVMLAVAGIS
jgi:hypothetical protein